MAKKDRSAKAPSVSALLKSKGFTRSTWYPSPIRGLRNKSFGFEVEKGTPGNPKDEASTVSWFARNYDEVIIQNNLDRMQKALSDEYAIERGPNFLIVRMKANIQ